MALLCVSLRLWYNDFGVVSLLALFVVVFSLLIFVLFVVVWRLSLFCVCCLSYVIVFSLSFLAHPDLLSVDIRDMLAIPLTVDPLPMDPFA